MYKEESDAAKRRCKKLLMMVNGVLQYDQAKPDADIDYVSQFVESEGRAISGKKMGAKTFLSRSQFMQMIASKPTEAASFKAQTWSTDNFCTFTTENILDMLAFHAAQKANTRVKEATELAESVGFTRQSKAISPKQDIKPVADSRSPRATPTPAPGAARMAPVPQTAPSGISVVKTLYPPVGRR